MVLHIKSIGLQWSNQTILVNLKSMWSESYRLMVENVESTTVQKYGMDQSQTRRLHLLLPFVLVRVWVKGWKLLGPQWIVWTGGKKKMLKLSTFDRCRYRLGYGTEAETVSRERAGDGLDPNDVHPPSSCTCQYRHHHIKILWLVSIQQCAHGRRKLEILID